MKIALLPDHDKSKFDDLASSCGTIFNTIGWGKIFGDKLQFYGIYTDNDRLIGGFILYKEDKFGLTIYRDPLFAPSIGPFLRIDAQNPTTIMDAWKEALSAMVDFISLLPFSVFSSSLSINIVDVQPFIWKYFKAIPRYTYLIDLTQSVDELWNRLSKVRKNEIKKAAKDGLVVKQEYDYECISKLVIKTFSRQNRKINEYYLNKILFEFANTDNSYAFISYKGSQPIAGTFCLYYNGTAYALVGGYDHEQKHRGAGPLVDWACIEYAHKLALKCFDFEGSMAPQIEKYMRGFGGKLTPYYRINKASFPLEVILKYKRRDLF